MNKLLLLGVIAFLVVVGGISLVERQNSLPGKNIQIYTDPDGYFTITIPPEWTDVNSNGTGTTGIGTTNQVTQTIETVTLQPTDKTSTNRMGVTIQVYEGEPPCSKIIDKNKITLNGMSAYYDSVHAEWFINTNRAAFTINGWYPGGPGVYEGPEMRVGQPTPTPVPLSIVNADKQIINQIINSFHPKNAQVLNC